MSLYEATVPQLKKMLNNLDKWLDAGVAYAQKKSFEPKVLLAARLAPDQYPLWRQVQAACDSAKFAGAHLGAKEAPKHEDTEPTIDELHARIRSVIAFLETITAADFEGGADRVVPLPFMPGKALRGTDYINELAIPNFYFHACMAYAILRHNGVDVGKRDFIGSLNLRDQ